VRPFDRQSEPDFWAEKERRWLRGDTSAKAALHGMQHQSRSLSAWFHEKVRPAREPRLCAYCDGPLKETSPETIDHFIPEHADRSLGLAWTNLFPACATCNSTFKGQKWSCRLVRPDREPVDRWFELDLETGRLVPALELDRVTRARVRLTIRVLGLNAEERCRARVWTWRSLVNAAKDPVDAMFLEHHASEGPYRVVAALFLKTMPVG